MAKKKDTVDIIVRLSPAVHKAAKTHAKKNFMSLNGLINKALEEKVVVNKKELA